MMQFLSAKNFIWIDVIGIIDHSVNWIEWVISEKFIWIIGIDEEFP